MSEDKGEGKNEHEHEHDEKKTFDRHARLESLTGLPTQMLNPLHIEAGEGGGEARESVVDVQRAEHARPVNRGSNAGRHCCCSCGWRGPLVCVVWSAIALAVCHALDLDLALLNTDAPCRLEHLWALWALWPHRMWPLLDGERYRASCLSSL